jgi:hypothetical protein
MERGVLVQRSMNSRFIIIGNKFAEDPAQVRLPEHDHVVGTFLSDRADQSLHVRILPWRSRCDRPVPNAHGAQTLYKEETIRSVPVANEIPRCAVPREGICGGC